MDHPRLSKEIQIRDSHAEGGDRDNPAADQGAEGDLDILADAFHCSENPFRDFRLPNPDLERAKATLAGWIMKALDEQGLSTRDAEAKTGIAHSEFSRIRNVKLTRFTLDRLFVIHEKLEPEARLFVDVKRP